VDELVLDGEVLVDDFEGDDIFWGMVLFGLFGAAYPEVDGGGATDTEACPHEVRAEA
jgi:hypothetical protein